MWTENNNNNNKTNLLIQNVSGIFILERYETSLVSGRIGIVFVIKIAVSCKSFV